MPDASILNAGYAPFITADIEMFRPAAPANFALSYAAAPWASLSLSAPVLEDAFTISVSDAGYRTESPVTAYPPFIHGGLTLDARIPLDPGQIGIVWAWGDLLLVNADRRYDDVVSGWNAEGRLITVGYGVKSFDASRGIFVDPESADLSEIFSGVVNGWLLSEFELSIQLRDASYWLRSPLQKNFYTGAGGYEGDPEIAGLPKPKTRGKVYHISLTLIDRTNRIYACNDGPADIVALYEGGAESIAFQADTTNLYAGATSPGNYRTDVSRGLIQLGSTPADNAILTADVVGHFPTAGLKTIAADIVASMLVEDVAMAASYVGASSFDDAAAEYPYEAGWHWSAGDKTDGASAVGLCLSSFGAKIVPGASGALECFVLAPIAIGETTVAEFSTATIKLLSPRALPQGISPVVYRARCAYQHNYTVQSSGLLGSATDATRQFVQSADRFSVWTDASVLLSFESAIDLPPFGGGLTTEADAQEVADRTGALFGVRRWAFDMEIPLAEGISLNFGDVVEITYPSHVTASGARARVTGRSFDTSSLTATITVLI